MASVASVEAAIAAKIELAYGSGGLGLVRCPDDYRLDLVNVADGGTLYQLRATQNGYGGQSGARTILGAYAVSLVHKLGPSEAERTYMLGDRLTLLARLTDETWWLDPVSGTGIAGVRQMLSDQRAFGVATKRTNRLIEDVVGPILLEINA